MKRIFSLILALMAVQMMWAAQITVTNTSDDVEEEGSLRWACATATAEDTIVFKFSTKGDKTIHISSSLSTKASIDGSTWADSIIIDGYDEENGTKGNFSGLSGTGPFVKNIIVQNCYDGICTSPNTIVEHCIVRNCSWSGFAIRGGESFVGCSSYNNNISGFTIVGGLSNATAASIEQCEIINNGKTGISCGVLSLKKCHVYDNNIGLNLGSSITKIVSDCVISGNDSIGILIDGMCRIELLYNNIIGLSEDQKKTYPNGTGIQNSGSVDTIQNNVISGNRKNGIECYSSRSEISLFTGNYIGTNKFFDQDPLLGNGEDGFVPSLQRNLKVFSDNYFGNNGGYAINSSHFSGNGLTSISNIILKNCYFGITPDGKPMPNRKGGINWAALMLILEDCHIGYNKGAGYEFSSAYSGIKLNVKGGSIIHNEGNGIEISVDACNLKAENVTFDSNGESAIYMDLALRMNKYYESLLSGNKFLHTNKAYPAFKTTDPYPVPEFTSCKMTEKTIVIEGKIDTAAKAKIELFYTSQGEQTAEMLVDSFYTNADGTFSDTLDRSMFVGKSIIGFTATATYGKITSPLSDVVYPELGKVDLTRTEFYVKIDGYGDGSTWDKAMSPQTFAYYLPQAKDGSTFYVAEGEYSDFVEKTLVVNSSLKIIGGYKDCDDDVAERDPSKYITLFAGGDLELNSSKPVSLINIQFSKFPISSDKKGKLYVEYCTFYGYSSSAINLQNVDSLIINNSNFHNSRAWGIINLSQFRYSCVSNSSFYNLSSPYTASVIFATGGTSMKIENSTFANNPSKSFIYTSGVDDIKFYNNTLVGNGCLMASCDTAYGQLGNFSNATFVGNIYLGNTYNKLILDESSVSYDNIFYDGFESSSSENILLPDESLPYFMDVKYDASIDRYIPNLTLNGGFTPTVALKSDKLSDGKSIRFPRLDDVLTDQRGVSRLEKTCMGAYEIGCGNDTTIATVADTINVGTKIYGQTFTEVGVHDGIFETLQNVNGCDSVVMHKVVVRPTAMNYYVKTKRVNKGDGSNWDNAMNDNDFITYLPLAPEGATFHVAAGEYLKKSDKLKSISVKNDVTIIGGYPADATKGAVSDPKKYSTHISLFRELTSDKDAVKVELYNLKFSDFSIVMNNYADFTLIVDKCKFQGYGTGSNVIYSGNKSVIKLTDSYFSGENNPTTLIAGMYGGTVDISGCTFAYYRKSDSYLIDISYPTYISLINSTIVYNVLNGVIGGATTHTNKLLNNTIVGNKFGNEFFHMTKQPPVFEGNIYAENGYEFVSTFSNTNIYNKKVSDILEGTVDETSGLFSPELKDNGGFTPTVALKSDKLSDGKSIRFPRLDDVLTDQRGVSRLPETCMGAYEIGCGSDTTFTTDTIIVGTKIFGQTFTKVGVHDSIFETLQTAIGCDSVVMHRVVVKPDPTTFNYYVKMDKEGRGDGSDWDNAMDSTDFATYLPLAPDGAVFYVAEGTYKPVYGVNLNVPSKTSDLCYAINSNVTIRGGYPADAKGKDVPSEPKKYETIFDGDDLYALFLAQKNAKSIGFYGIVINNPENGILRIINDADSLIVQNSYFSNCGSAILESYNSKFASVKNTIFSKNNSSIYIRDVFSAEIKGCSFVENQGYLILDQSYDNGSTLTIDSVSFTDNEGNLVMEGKVGVDIVNSNFYNTSGHVNNSSSSMSIRNCKIEKSEDNWLNGSSPLVNVDSCIFNENKSVLIYGLSSDLSLRNTIVKDNFNITIAQVNDCYIEKSTFYDNDHEYVDSDPMISANDIKVENSTFSNNRTGYGIFFSDNDKGKMTLNNNTFLGVRKDIVFGGQKTRASLKGNIILYNDSVDSSGGSVGPSVHEYESFSKISLFENNLIFGTETMSGFEIGSNKFVDEHEIGELLEGSYTTEGFQIFIPVLKDNGGFTPTVALKSDKLSDGRSIRFPRLENVLTDQRGVERLDSTCMGAYEMKCNAVETVLKDTVMVGDSYTFIDKNLDDVCQKVGSYHFTETLKSVEGCDSIVKLSLAVRPQKNENGYYVKEDGTGDGSDWNNAMSPKDFAEFLPLVYDGETFHIAAGTYKSTYVDPELGRMYNINSSVTLIGGYPDTVTTVGVPPMPDVFTTTLTASTSGKEYISIYKDRPGDYSVNGFRNNDSILICVNGTPTVSLYGISLSGVKSDNYGAVTMNDGGILNLDKCAIVSNNASGIVASNAKINVTSTLAYQNVTKDGAVFRLSDSELNVEHSSFHENISSGESADSKGTVANLTNSQATFTNNTVANNWADMGGVFALSNSQVSLVNNTLVGNQSIAKEPKGSFVSASDTKSKVSLFGNMIVGNGAQPVDGAAVESEGYNIFSTDFQGLGVATDMFMGSKDYEFIIDGKPLQNNADVFIASVNDNGGFTPTVAVIESMFDGGAVISIPSDQRKVKFDQREMVRKDTSCVGAFEFPTYVNYFVKQSPVGDGTGRDWDNAMGDSTFFRYFSIVPAGATFHVAAGTYHPLADRLYNIDSYKDRKFYSSRPLNVFGGYHPQAKIGAVADPSKYVTLLSSDFNGDDEFSESDNNYSVMSYSNYKDNSSYVMTIISKLAGDVHLKGLTFSGNFTQFRGSSAALTVSTVAPEIPIALTIDSCSFEKTYVGIYSYADSLIVRNCRFDTIEYLGVSHYPRENVPSMLVVGNSSFTNMSSAISTLASKGRIVLQNSTFNNAMSLVNVNTNSYNNVVDLNLEMYHNTFGFSSKSYQGISIPQYIKTIAKGNIFNTNFLLTSDYSGTNAMTPIVSDYNLFVEEPDTTFGAWTLGENDMLVAPSDLTGVMPGTMGEKRFLAVSSMEKSENFTKVVALESDVLNEKYIRMPIEEAKVKADQIATERLDLTCMGAYEFFKGRDTVYTHNVDTVCLGLAYDRNGWQLQSDTLPVGKYVYGRFLRGKIATDTIDTLTLHVNPFSKIMLDQLAVAPTLCHGDGYGEVMFTPYSVVPGSANVYVKDETGDTIPYVTQRFNSVYNNKELPLGKFDINIISQTQCVKDTSIHIEVVDRDSLQPLNKIDNILTDCANEPTSVLSISMKGFHPKMKFYHNDVEVTEETKDDELVYEDNAAVTSLAGLNLSNIPVGKHIITAVDACDNTYVLSEFDVSVSPSQLVEMQLVDYTKDSLACGLDSGFAKFNIISGATSVFTLTSDEGYDYTLRLQGKDTVLVLNDLVRGNYKALLKKVDEKCSDSSEAEFSIFSPEPLSLSLASNGAACAEGAVNAVAQGGRGSYTFHWTDPSGKSFDTTTPVLSEASAGTYKCVVEDATHCLSHTESLSILPNVEELSELHVDSVATKNITCINGNNGTIEVYFSTDNKQQSVACAVTNDATGEVTSVAGTYKNLNGLLAIRTLAVGSYSYEVYYGSETCRLDTNSFKGTFTVSAKAVPFKMSPLAVASPQTCFNPANGTISNTVTGWENDYKAYMVSKTGGKYMMSPVEENGDTKLKVDTLSAGSFYYVVEDACGSKINTDTVALPKYEPLSLEIISFTDSVTCARATDANITFSVSGGIGQNHLAYIDEKAFTDKDTIVSDDNGKGYHYVAYKSVVEGCKDSVGERIRIAGPDTLAIKFTLNGNCPGSALIPEVTGESAPYTYWWSDGENDIEGTAEFPYEMEEGRTYSLTVSDDHKCDEYTKSFTIPSAAELPSISHVVSPSSEKCYKGNNGNIKVKASISKPLDFAISATIKCEKVDDPKTSFVYQCVLDPDGTYNTPETLSPGYYRVTTRLGSFDCDMGVDPADTVVHVDTLSPLNIQSDFKLTPHTCEQANGTAKFNVEGWVNTHTAILYTLDENRTTEIKPAFVTNYVADFRLKLRHGKYKVVVIDKCGQSDTSDVFEILHKPTFVDKVTSKPATCINEPNGVLDFDVHGWTSNHTCELINKDNAEFGYFGNVKPVEVVDSTKFAHFRIETIPAGEWRIRVTNECGDNCQFENLVKVDGIDPYKVELIANESKLELTCPYDTNGVISLNVTGGCKDALLSGNTTRKVTYWGPTGIFVDSFVWEEKEIYTIVPIFDTLNPIIENDTTFNIASMDTVPDHNGKDSIVINYDTIVTQRTTYPQLVDKEGNLVNDTIVTIDSIQVSIPVEKYGWLDSLATSPIEYDAFIADPEGFKSGKYKFVNLRAATYRFTYKSTLEGCTDNYDFDTKVTKPDDVHLNYSVMSITCSTKSDGEISLAPRRGSKSYSSYFVGHDSTDAYEKNRLYKHDLIDGKDSIVEYKLNDETQSYQINQLYDQTDLTSVSWSFSQTKDGKFVQMSDIIFPDSTDFYEEIYYKNGNPTTSPVYSNSHLEKFWKDRMGEYFEANVVSIANLRHGFYEALVVDNKACKYRDTIEVKYPAKPLKIDSVVFDEALAECNPTARQIMTYVSGGWGDYGFSFSDQNTSSDSPGETSDGYRGGEASYSDNDKLEGWGVSSFLDPGTYKVAVFDKNGCIVESPNKYTVKTTFSLSIDTVETVCAEDDSAAVAIKFIESPVSGMTYDVVEYESPCRTDAMDECREFTLNTKKQNVTPDGNAIVLNLSTEKRRIKTHGLFVYKNDDNHCGTYVEGTVVDTIPIFKASRKSIKDVTCNGLADGMIELFVNGGKAPYKVQRNSSWNSGDELALYAGLNDAGLNTLVHKDTLKIIDLNDTTKNRDTVIVTNYVQITDLPADSFYFTVVDAKGCRSVMGNPANYDEKIFVKEPEALHVDFAASIVCKLPSVTTGGNVFFQNLTGGVAPYTLSYKYSGETEFEKCEPVVEIPVAVEGFKVDMKVTDANNCTVDSVVAFRPGELNVDQYDFWATTWYEFGDVVALIDVCGPDDILDSVAYVFKDETGTVDPRIKILDERMYIYDLESNRTAQNTLLHYADRTKEVVPDLFFKKNFRLRDGLTEDQAKHLHFFKFEDSLVSVTKTEDLQDVLAKHSVLMKAYFNGCEYQVDRNGADVIGVMKPGKNDKLDKIGQKYQIISLTGSPNPFKSDETVTIRATFTEKVDAKLYFYHIDGKTSKYVDISAGELNEKNGEFVYSKSFKPSELLEGDVPDYIIVFLTTGRDQKAATLFHSGVLDFSKTDN
ncbi:MAG: right-handed parallel beta-helix repeat-containing protein [Bacteroidales bacterium]|nr:right-handed parallel beta-helix repeat-containing protein [Bacteroidales bacterium]